jgi:hypothetical protein
LGVPFCRCTSVVTALGGSFLVDTCANSFLVALFIPDELINALSLDCNFVVVIVVIKNVDAAIVGTALALGVLG